MQKGEEKKINGPVSTAMRASSMLQRMWVRILALKPSLQIASQSKRDCSEAAVDVSSMYSTPKASKALAMAILVLVSKNALANCSPSNFFPPMRWIQGLDVENKNLVKYSRWYWSWKHWRGNLRHERRMGFVTGRFWECSSNEWFHAFHCWCGLHHFWRGRRSSLSWAAQGPYRCFLQVKRHNWGTFLKMTVFKGEESITVYNFFWGTGLLCMYFIRTLLHRPIVRT